MKVNMVPVSIIIKYGCVFVAWNLKFIPIPVESLTHFHIIIEINAIL